MSESIFPIQEYEAATARYYAIMHELEQQILILAEEFGLLDEPQQQEETPVLLTRSIPLRQIAA